MVKSESKPAIGILGGTFDPVHFGHLRTGLDVVEQLGLAQLRLMPCAIPPHRIEPVASASERRLMLELAIKNHPKLVVDDRELSREGPSYTVDTLLSLREDYPDNPLFVLMGTDAFCSLPTWSRWQQILELAHIVVMQRADETLQMSAELADCYQQHQAKAGDESLSAGKIWSIPVTQMAISATMIRDALLQHRDVRYLLPDAVIALIEQLHFYQKADIDN
ncbi:Nicotinate-nucleotide adenylyltransferase [Methylophaga thiooxydans]|uniref:Probable nicotinate-nucleotide adenylyltransferase n=1 Tax=Methylophaga thiooxydans TaxID=392484 RepID=A0A0A0BCY2_9GAMM|nr:nicotinate-nucleotide adenylyltransferase [Methylophaga thiooxydans]KGM06433.1 Nicotinate-nucleotide adenylyltransferase [Methylophaga thiooxydans]